MKLAAYQKGMNKNESWDHTFEVRPPSHSPNPTPRQDMLTRITDADMDMLTC